MNKIYTAAHICWCGHGIGANWAIRELESGEASEVTYENGMVSFKLAVVAEWEKDGKTHQKILEEEDKEYFFGEFTSLENLKADNMDGRWNTAIKSVEDKKGIGMVTSPNGFHSVMLENDVVIDASLEKENKK